MMHGRHIASKAVLSVALERQPLRVLVLTPGVDGMGGISRMMNGVADEVAGRQPTDLSVRFVSTRCDARLLRPFVFLASLVLVSIACILRRCDVLHINLSSFGSTYRKLLLAGIARFTGVPYVLHLHSGQYREFWKTRSQALTGAINALFRSARQIIVLGPAWADLVVEHVPEATCRITVLPNATREPAKSRSLNRGGTEEPICILFLGLLNDAKGVPLLLKALGALASDTRWSAVLAGNGDVSGTREAVRILGIKDRVDVPGWLGPEDVERLWQRGDIFVLPSFIENLPLSIVEAFAHGVPVICTPVGSIPEIVEHGRTGLIVPVGDSEALAEALSRLIKDERLRSALAEAGRQEFAARFEISGYVDRLITLWRTVAVDT